MTEKKKEKLKSLIRFHSANKIDNYNREGDKGKKIQKNLQSKSNHKNNNCFFLSHCCQSLFPHWESQSASPPQDVFQHCADLWTYCRGSSDSNLVLFACVLAWRIPGTGEPGGLPSTGLHRVRHDCCDLAAAEHLLQSCVKVT